VANCQLREPAFFGRTLHVVDVAHGKGHKCPEVYKLSLYKRHAPDKQLRFFNDSAAECGNAGLGKLRASARYMGKARFMDYARLQLEVQNRVRELSLSKRAFKQLG
jgi:hypothetical protein